MKKNVIIINGNGGAGKDTIIKIIKNKFDCENISSVDKIKEAGEILGWSGKKDNKSRKFLSDIKQASINYNNYPIQYMISKLKILVHNELFFFHIREPEQIENFINEIYNNEINCTTTALLVRRNLETYGNTADDEVEHYNYDYIIDNSLGFYHLNEEIQKFLEYIDLKC